MSAGAAVSTAATAVAPQGSPGRDIHAHRVLILDFGSQYTQLIASAEERLLLEAARHSAE